MRILLMGPKACGKGTVGERLSEELKLPIFSVGQLLRDVPENHPRYVELNDIMDKGIMVPQDLVADIIKKRISESDCSRGYILDGWFRTMEDLKHFDFKPDKVLVINISDETSIKRVTGRRMCDTDGKIYNIYTLPKEELEKCKGNLVQRDDDTEEAVIARLKNYHTNTVAVIDTLKERGTSVYEISGEGTPEEVFQQALKVLKPST